MINHHNHSVRTPQLLYFWALFALIIPNIILDLTDKPSTLWGISNILLPLGVYGLLLALNRKIGMMVLFILPFMILGAFQMVLSYLYGESIIAVDMFLNVMTTNVTEATELLGNLLPPIIAILLLYLPPIIWAIISLVQKKYLPAAFLKAARIGSSVIILSAVIFILIALNLKANSTSLIREIFPINVIDNLITAIDRTKRAANYHETSTDFSYGAASTRDTDTPEIYVMVIGETSRAINWELQGYDRPTNPRLSKQNNLVFFPYSISQSNTTHKSVPMLISALEAENFDSIDHYKSIITAMKEAGFTTWFISNQAPNHSYTQFFGEEADSVIYTIDPLGANVKVDSVLLSPLRAAINKNEYHKQFFLLHSYGSHFKYSDRYTPEHTIFSPDEILDATPSNRTELINAYDNSIVATDALLADIIAILEQSGHPSALTYSADHGEDIFDDNRKRFLHASPTPTYYQLHVATLAWVSPQLNELHPEFLINLQANARKCVAPQRAMFPTTLQLAGVNTPYLKYDKSLADRTYSYGPAMYVTDHNNAVALHESGLKPCDLRKIAQIIK